jgi:D-3-phosphoglycerate dehydrogenase
MEILITTPSFGQQSTQPWEALEREGLTVRRPKAAHPLAAGQLVAELGNSQAVIVGLDAVDVSVFAAAPQLKVVAKHGVGVDNIDCEAAKAAGVRVLNAPGSNSGAVADLTFGLMLGLARQLIPAHNSLTAGRWDRFPGIELTGRTLAILGYGRIGQAVAKRGHGFDMDIVAYDPYVPADVFAAGGVRQAGLEECVASADFLSLHMPGVPGAAPLIDAAMLRRMKKGAFLINAARGGLVDEQVLVQLLHDGHLAGAALDAFAQEPIPEGSPLLSAPNMLITPHIGAYSDLANTKMGVMVATDVARVLRGEQPHNAVV